MLSIIFKNETLVGFEGSDHKAELGHFKKYI